MKLKNTLLSYILEIPLLYVLVFGVHNLTDLNIWCGVKANEWNETGDGV